jgi:predicted XRE-type DNA-binding protein
MNDDLELVRGSDHVFVVFGDADAETKRLKAKIATDIIATLNARNLSVRAAAKIAAMDGADIQRIRNADLSRFTIDRLVRVAFRLGRKVDIKLRPIDEVSAA